MEWELRAGREAWVIPLAVERNQPLPAWVDEEPDLEPLERFFLDAFWDLSTCRALGMVIGPIPTTAMREYADRYQLDWENSRDFVTILREMDAGFLDWHRTKRPGKLDGDGAKDEGKRKHLGSKKRKA